MSTDGATEPPPLKKEDRLVQVIVRKFINFLGAIGALLFLYGVAVEAKVEQWSFLEHYATPLSNYATILGTLVTAVTVYFWKTNPHPPEKFSKFFSVPIVIASCLSAFFVLYHRGQVQPHIINGLALLAIAGGLFRIQPQTSE